MKTRTTKFERFLLFGIIISFPLQAVIPTVGGASLSFIIFAIAACYLIIWRPQVLMRTLQHPIFIAGFIFIGIGLFLEFAHSSFGYILVGRIGMMVLGGVFIASLCRDRSAFDTCLLGILMAGVVVSYVFVTSNYSDLAGAQVDNLIEANRLRKDLMRGNPLEKNLNQLAFMAAQGAVAGLVLVLTAKTPSKRNVFLAICAFCLVGTFLPMSRSGILIFFLTACSIFFTTGLMKPRVLIGGLVLIILVVAIVPEAVWVRLTISTEKRVGTGSAEDSRVSLYGRVLDQLPDIFLSGVGANHYYGNWGKTHGFFAEGRNKAAGTHNCLAQVIMFWGLPGLLAFCAFLWQGYRFLPKQKGLDSVRLGILGISLSMFLRAMFMHQLNDKGFSIAFGMLAGASLWILPKTLNKIPSRIPVLSARTSQKVNRSCAASPY